MDATRHSRPWAAAAALFIGVFLLYAFTVDLDGASNDVHTSSLASWRIATTGQPWLEDVDLDATGAPADTLWIGEAPNSHIVAFRSPGVIAAGVPAYLVGDRNPASDSFSLLPGALTAVSLTTIALILFWLAVRGSMTRLAALGSTAVLAFATPMWTVAGDQLWTHSVTVVGVLGMAWAAHRERWWLVGLFGGVALWGRLHTAIVVAVLGIGVSLVRRDPIIAFKVGTVSGAMLGLASLWSQWMYGSWNPSGGYFASGYVDRAATGVGETWQAQLMNHVGLWLSFDRGFAVWSPVLLLLLPAVRRNWSQLPEWSRCLAVGGIAYTLVQGQLNGFTGGGGFFGYRLTLELLVAIAPAFALSLHRTGPWARRLMGPAIGAQVAVMVVGAMSNALFIDGDRAWVDNSYWLAMRSDPIFGMWLCLMILIGWLSTLLWMDRGRREVLTTLP